MENKRKLVKRNPVFTKKLSADQINLSVLKGEGELKSLELDETTLMELLDLPTWLYLRKAHCSNISFKVCLIRWTKLETHPVSVVIDRVDVELEALEEPRPAKDSIFLSRLTLVSKTPKWQNGALNLTSLPFPAGDAVLIFKEISWDSIRLVADGLLSELNGIPVKLITNTGRIRLTLKKRLSGKNFVLFNFLHFCFCSFHSLCTMVVIFFVSNFHFQLKTFLDSFLTIFRC
ncbi:unnamed protein product [Echinostoma caproni]|uniref:Uncharacterized protein n=1 Tax=Echinostoma caproni TaxID=27848 RepID=A0A3P8HPN4_9TREM|nr:unnamed protein product [Echinostoma caproni]